MEQLFNQALKTAQGLRDFFFAPNHEQRVLAVHNLFAAVKQSVPVFDSVRLEYLFNRLFVGPDIIFAPPYASVYLDKEPLLMGQSTLQMRDLLRSLELAVPEGGEPDDFIAYELEIWAILVQFFQKDEMQLPENKEIKQSIFDALMWLNEEHLAKWLPCFIKKVQQSDPMQENSQSPEIICMRTVFCIMENWLQSSLQRSLYEKK